MVGDLSVFGPQAVLPRKIAASATRYASGEPLSAASITWSTGTASSDYFTLSALDILVIG